MNEVIIASIALCFCATVGAVIGSMQRRRKGVDVAPAGFEQAPVEESRLDGPYPHGSVPYGGGPESLALRAKRFACAAVNHHPRSYNGSWCSGYGYVCSRCHMYADRIPDDEQKRIIDDLNAHGGDIAAAYNPRRWSR